MDGVSIVFAYHNDVDDLREALDSLYRNIDIDNFEVIVVNDGGKKKLTDYKKANLLHIDNPINLGIGRALDLGVGAARNDIIFLSGADIVYLDNSFASRMLTTVKDHPEALVCPRMTSFKRPERSFFGADILFKINEEDLPKSSKLRNQKFPHKSILEGKWRRMTENGVYQIPSIMGAFYGVTKSWYEYIKGFNCHYIWGSLEPYISLKSWLLGGEAVINTDIEILHKSQRTGFADKSQYAITYNRLMISFIVFGAYGIQFMEHYGQSHTVERAAEMYMNAMNELAPLRTYIEEHAVMEPEELHKKMVAMSDYHQRKGLTE